MALIAFTALIPIFVFTSIVYVVLGERALRLFRSRYPVEWTKRDEPSFVVLVPSWRRYYSPAAASNFFISEISLQRLSWTTLTPDGWTTLVAARLVAS